ncbi:transcriptional regulator [Streptomyces verrucosisporus]|uniref:helix-turn-helix domain-containing protein n=1 Tax=Streptomyces verrucosisporus TaxID=1695161 RepID=UPI0019D1E847|nr:transcriptional regulator [Streptomyces verrucosisporus]MBN3932417.1 transcriptional regulator [Streptomyces verrucosisporus]
MTGQPEEVLQHPLSYARAALGMGKARFAETVRLHGRLLGHNLGTTRSTVFKWERGDHVPDDPTQEVIAHLLQIPESVRKAAPWPRWLPAWDSLTFAAPWTQTATLEALTSLAGSGPMDRRGFLGIGGAALVGIGTQWAAADPAIAAAATGEKVTPATVDRMSDRVESLRAMEQETGGGDYLDSARTDLSLISRMLKNGRYSEETAQRLYTLAAEVCCLLGWMSYDASLHTAAQQHYTAALRAAKTAGDDTLGAHTLCFMATQAANQREQRAAVGLMEAADAVRDRVPATMRASLAAHQTTVYTKAGDKKRAAAALNRAFDALDRGDHSDTPPYLEWFGEAQLRSTEGRFLLATGQAAKATEALERSVNQAAPRDRAVRYGTLALAHQRNGDLDGALDATHKAAHLIEEGIHSQRGVERLQEVRKAFAPYRNEAKVKEASERIAALTA